jgi:hypothetical protein
VSETDETTLKIRGKVIERDGEFGIICGLSEESGEIADISNSKKFWFFNGKFQLINLFFNRKFR